MGKGTGFALIALILGGCGWWVSDHWTPQAAEQGKIRSAIKTAATTAANHSAGLYTTMNADFQQAGDVNVQRLRNTVVPRALVANGIRNVYEEGIRTTNGETVREIQPFVDPQHPWQNCIPFYGPLHIKAAGYVNNLLRRTRSDASPFFQVPTDDGFEHVGPNGTQLPEEVKDYALPVQDHDHFLAFVGRVAGDQTRQPLVNPFLIGTERTLDPAQIGASGCLQVAVNQNLYLSDASGQFGYSYEPVLAK